VTTPEKRSPRVRLVQRFHPRALAAWAKGKLSWFTGTSPKPAQEFCPSPLQPHPIAALLDSRIGRKGTFHCPIHRIVMLNGFGFDFLSWHPFAAALQEYRLQGALPLKQTVLYRFYQVWRPQNAAEAIVGWLDRPEVLRVLPAHGYHFTPWCTNSAAEELIQLETFNVQDCEEHQDFNLDINRDGFKYHGPVSDRLCEVERRRLVDVYRSILSRGYDRQCGDIRVFILRRGPELRFVCRGGVHRLAAMQALGHASIPATLSPPYLVDSVESSHWPQVVNGAWDPEVALRYFNHLHDFNAREWAEANGLLPAAQSDPEFGNTG
jgi:hypothetical protein